MPQRKGPGSKAAQAERKTGGDERCEGNVQSGNEKPCRQHEFDIFDHGAFRLLRVGSASACSNSRLRRATSALEIRFEPSRLMMRFDADPWKNSSTNPAASCSSAIGRSIAAT